MHGVDRTCDVASCSLCSLSSARARRLSALVVARDKDCSNFAISAVRRSRCRPASSLATSSRPWRHGTRSTSEVKFLQHETQALHRFNHTNLEFRNVPLCRLCFRAQATNLELQLVHAPRCILTAVVQHGLGNSNILPCLCGFREAPGSQNARRSSVRGRVQQANRANATT